jgi:single-stranded-DNA-specific exonuclease
MYAGTQKFGSKRSNEAKKWHIHPANPNARKLAAELKVSPLLAQILINRGITRADTGRQFLSPKLTGLIQPEKMPGVKGAIPIIKNAIKEKQKITVYGDYDVDGITGVAILWHLLTLLGAKADYYIPHRIEEGYGLNCEAVEQLAKDDCKLLITVDCGIGANAAAKCAKQEGLDLIITDHHLLSSTLPEASAIVHPALEASYENQDSSGSMVAFKLAWALANEFSDNKKMDGSLRQFMLNAVSLAAMGTIADIVDLRGENRILASFGLKAIPESKLVGIEALIETAGLSGKGIDSYEVGFKLAPMLNAAGRMGHARLAVELLTIDNPARAKEIADYLKQQNSQRQQVEKKILNKACEQITKKCLNKSSQKTIVLWDKNWHTGVIGIVASRIVDKYNKPTILINCSACGEQGRTEEKIAQGSARSIDGFNILEAIASCSKHLTSFGGHKMAAGIKIEEQNLEQFAEDFEEFAKRSALVTEVSTLHIDVDAALDEFNAAVIKELSLLEPFGQGNPKPVFATKAVRLCSPPRKCGANSDHLQLAITDNKKSIKCVGFRFAPFEKKLLEHDCFHIAYHPQINTYNGSSTVEFVLTDIQFED